MNRHRFPLRVPKNPHQPGDRCVPVSGCGCITCKTAREDREADAEAAHWERVGQALGIDAEARHGHCDCGKPLAVDGRCSEYWNCAFSVEGACR